MGANGAVELGLGLISLGREWATRKPPLPTLDEARGLLELALDLGIRFLDTAPCYGSSEEKLGIFLRSLPTERLSGLVVATKCGEEWIEETRSTKVDHSYDSLCRSIDRSLDRLPVIHLLQIHKATAEVVTDTRVLRALDYAGSRGITEFGASVKDLDAARYTLANPLFSYLQFPFNILHPELREIFEMAEGSGRKLIINRPLAMGSLVLDQEGRTRGVEAIAEAFRFVMQHSFSGVLLMGTSSETHLRQNIVAWHQVLPQV